MRTVRSTSCAGTVLRARINVRSELENEVHSEDHGHARDESSCSGLVHFRAARQVGVRFQSKCNITHRHARVDAEDVIGKREQTGTWVREAARAIDEQLKKDKQELEMREQRKRAEDANRICSIINEKAENKGLSLVEAEMEKLMHQDEQELLSVWEG